MQREGGATNVTIHPIFSTRNCSIPPSSSPPLLRSNENSRIKRRSRKRVNPSGPTDGHVDQPWGSMTIGNREFSNSSRVSIPFPILPFVSFPSETCTHYLGGRRMDQYVSCSRSPSHIYIISRYRSITNRRRSRSRNPMFFLEIPASYTGEGKIYRTALLLLRLSRRRHTFSFDYERASREHGFNRAV